MPRKINFKFVMKANRQLNQLLPNNHLVLQSYRISTDDVYRQPKRISRLFDKINTEHVLLPKNQELDPWHHIDKIVL